MLWLTALRRLRHHIAYLWAGMMLMLCGLVIGMRTYPWLSLVLIAAGLLVILGAYTVLFALGLAPLPQGKLRTPIWQCVGLAIALALMLYGLPTTVWLDKQYVKFALPPWSVELRRARSVQDSLLYYQYDISNDSFPGPDMDIRRLQALLINHYRMSSLKGPDPLFTLDGYTPIDADGDGIYEDCILRLGYTKDAPKGDYILVPSDRRAKLTVCPPYGMSRPLTDAIAQRAVTLLLGPERVRCESE